MPAMPRHVAGKQNQQDAGATSNSVIIIQFILFIVLSFVIFSFRR
jgi:hypothetical protein